jgi:hypothetical protein
MSLHVDLVANVIGMAEGAGAVSKAECMLFSVSCDGAGRSQPRSINGPLGLTVYCLSASGLFDAPP